MAPESRRQLLELPPLERPLELADHDRIETTIDGAQLGQQTSGLRPIRPRHPTRHSDIEVLGHDPTASADEIIRLRALPPVRRRPILMISGGDPAVEREPQTDLFLTKALRPHLALSRRPSGQRTRIGVFTIPGAHTCPKREASASSG